MSSMRSRAAAVPGFCEAPPPMRKLFRRGLPEKQVRQKRRSPACFTLTIRSLPPSCSHDYSHNF